MGILLICLFFFCRIEKITKSKGKQHIISFIKSVPEETVQLLRMNKYRKDRIGIPDIKRKIIYNGTSYSDIYRKLIFSEISFCKNIAILI